jgi:hypothetical protein
MSRTTRVRVIAPAAMPRGGGPGAVRETAMDAHRNACATSRPRPRQEGRTPSLRIAVGIRRQRDVNRGVMEGATPNG